MSLLVRGKNIEVTPALKDYVEKRLGRVQKYFDDEAEIQVGLSVVKESHIVEVTVLLNGLILRGEDKTPDMYASVDSVVDKIERQIAKYKTKINRKLRQKGLKDINDQQLTPDREEGEAEPAIVRTKRFEVKPMPVEEAILQMNLLGHDFFVFANAETEGINVLYRRKDGNYGLIQPDY